MLRIELPRFEVFATAVSHSCSKRQVFRHVRVSRLGLYSAAWIVRSPPPLGDTFLGHVHMSTKRPLVCALTFLVRVVVIALELLREFHVDFALVLRHQL